MTINVVTDWTRYPSLLSNISDFQRSIEVLGGSTLSVVYTKATEWPPFEVSKM
jgi:hypothetical protein